VINTSLTVCAQESTVTDLKVEGNKSLSSSAILAKVEIRIGDMILEETLNEDIKRLYTTGYFGDVKVRLEPFKDGKRVVFVVEEKPILKEINLQGNTVIDNKTILKKIVSEIDTFLNPRILKSDIDKVRQLYEERGFTGVRIDYDIDVDNETNRAIVNIKIEEGAKLKIQDIQVEGNKAYPDRKILKLIQTRKDTLFTSGIYKESVLKEDIKRIESFYRKNGYLDAQSSYDVKGTETKNKLIVIIDINEGKKYISGEIEVEGNKKFQESAIRENLELNEGDTFSHEKLKQDIANIQSFYFGKGYIFADVKVDTKLNAETDRIDIRYNITEGSLAYIDKINIEGNTKTKDIVIRRELKVYPGEPFDGEKLRRSKGRLDNLGIFQSVSFDTGLGTAPNRKDLIVNVKEAKTGEFSFGAGYSSIDEFVGFIELRQRNFDYKNWPTFTGDGQQVSIKTEFGTVREDYDLSFTEPWIFDKPVSFGFDVYQHSRERERDVGYAYDQRRRGGDIRLGKEFGEYLRGDLMYRYDRIKISDVADDASSALKAEVGRNDVSSLKLGITRDTRDNIYNPTKGLISYFSVETAGSIFGGDKDFMKYIAGSSWYFSFFQDHVLELKVRAGIVDAYGDSDSVPLYERFYAGGANTIRGYEVRAVGPKDSQGEDPIGGESMLIGNAEYVFPIIKNFKAALFFDVGNVWEKVSDFGQEEFESALGAGVRIETPIGPVKLDYGYPLGETSNGRLHFSMGRTF